MLSNIIGPLPKKSDEPSKKVKKKPKYPLPLKSDAPIEKVEKASGYLDDIKNPLVSTIDTVGKKGK